MARSGVARSAPVGPPEPIIARWTFMEVKVRVTRELSDQSLCQSLFFPAAFALAHRALAAAAIFARAAALILRRFGLAGSAALAGRPWRAGVVRAAPLKTRLISRNWDSKEAFSFCRPVRAFK